MESDDLEDAKVPDESCWEGESIMADCEEEIEGSE